MTTYISYRRLKKMGACPEELAKFRAVFGTTRRVALSFAALSALAHSFNLDWLAFRILSPAQLRKHHRRVYEMNTRNLANYHAARLSLPTIPKPTAHTAAARTHLFEALNSHYEFMRAPLAARSLSEQLDRKRRAAT